MTEIIDIFTGRKVSKERVPTHIDVEHAILLANSILSSISEHFTHNGVVLDTEVYDDYSDDKLYDLLKYWSDNLDETDDLYLPAAVAKATLKRFEK